VQLGKVLGAHVTAVCSARNMAMVRELGADQVVDYTATDFVTTDKPWEVIFDAVGKRSFAECRRALTKEGIYLTPVLSVGALLAMLRTSRSGGPRAVFSASGLIPASEKLANMRYLASLLEAGQLRSVIEREYRLDQVAEAHRHVETGHKRGNLAVVMTP
jgi:NADPH:quinone reductase-like Zn-dependent oxidoreductase